MPRVLDVVLSLAAVVVLSPLLLAIAAVNYVLTGAILFRQPRIGRDLRPFMIMKFQTMVAGAERGSTIALDGDRRTTAFGRLLRLAKLDELPQLVNILRGEMSLVGPRALPASEVSRLPRSVAARVYSVRPGMTGLASLMLTDEGKLLTAAADPEEHYFRVILPEKAALEMLYVARRSPRLDALIILATPVAIVFPEAVRRLFIRFFDGAAAPPFSRSGDPSALQSGGGSWR